VERESRGGRSGGEVVWRGWTVRNIGFSSVEPGPVVWTMAIVRHQESLRTGVEVAGACGNSRFWEQVGPEQGRSLRGAADAGSTESNADS
jgi:hypothetical protein